MDAPDTLGAANDTLLSPIRANVINQGWAMLLALYAVAEEQEFTLADKGPRLPGVPQTPCVRAT